MKKGQIIEGTVKRIKFANKGIVKISGEEKEILVKDVLPDQKVCVSVSKIRRGQAEGRLLEVLEKATDQIDPPCPHFGACGGCTYQHFAYDKQLQMKAEQVKEMMDHAIHGDYIWEGIISSPITSEYRNKMEFTFGDEYKDGPMTLGMHKRGCFHSIVNTPDCQIVDGDFRNLLDCTLQSAKNSGLPFGGTCKRVWS